LNNVDDGGQSLKKIDALKLSEEESMGNSQARIAKKKKTPS